VLDVGCGVGFLALALVRQGAIVTGVDASSSSVKAANARMERIAGWMGALHCSAPPYPFDDATYDVVTCIETIEHLDDASLTSLLTETRRLLRPGGVALFTTPNAEVLEDHFTYCPFCDTEFHRMQHVRSFSARSLSSLLSDSGFDVTLATATNLARFGVGIHSGPRYRSIGRALWRALARARVIVTRDRLRPFLVAGPHLCCLATPRR
jgi:SAM-dependent methyltransferase